MLLQSGAGIDQVSHAIHWSMQMCHVIGDCMQLATAVPGHAIVCCCQTQHIKHLLECQHAVHAHEMVVQSKHLLWPVMRPLALTPIWHLQCSLLLSLVQLHVTLVTVMHNCGP